jgi:hypothetical protein
MATFGAQSVLARQTSDVPDRASSRAPIVVSRPVLQAAMAAELAKDYNAATTTNSARFFADVVLDLAADAQAADPHGPPLLLRHADWFDAFLDAAGIEASRVPLHVKLAYEYQQDVMIDYDIDRVIKSVDGERPRLAVSVQIGWPESLDLPSKYSYEDTLASPKLQITNHRMIRHRLLHFGDVVSYDDVNGMTGRPTTGFLATVFKVIGEGHIDWSRIYIAEDGMQVTRGSAHKGPFSVTETINVRPDGKGDKGLPADTPEWRAIEDRLKEKPDIEYHKWSLPEFDARW